VVINLRTDPRLKHLNIPPWYEQIIAPRPLTLDEYVQWNDDMRKNLNAEQKAFLQTDPVEVPFEL
jgi:hypothetical protein